MTSTTKSSTTTENNTTTSNQTLETVQDIRKGLLKKGGKYLESMGKLKVLTGMIGADSLASAAKRAARNQDVEEQIALKALGGDGVEVPSITELNDMAGGMHLGDVNHPQPQPIVINTTPPPQPQQNSLLGTVATMILGATLGGGGLAIGQLLNKAETVVNPPADTETMNLGLGRIEDYLKEK